MTNFNQYPDQDIDEYEARQLIENNRALGNCRICGIVLTAVYDTRNLTGQMCYTCAPAFKQVGKKYLKEKVDKDGHRTGEYFGEITQDIKNKVLEWKGQKVR